jgi:presenilin-like A22 family membrane protease
LLNAFGVCIAAFHFAYPSCIADVIYRLPNILLYPNKEAFSMTQASFPNNDSSPAPMQPAIAKQQLGTTAEVIRALTPIFIALIGGIIGISVLVSNTNNAAAGFGVASAAIAGAAGLAQPNKETKDP